MLVDLTLSTTLTVRKAWGYASPYLLNSSFLKCIKHDKQFPTRKIYFKLENAYFILIDQNLCACVFFLLLWLTRQQHFFFELAVKKMQNLLNQRMLFTYIQVNADEVYQ
jgi:hypothetical protein